MSVYKCLCVCVCECVCLCVWVCVCVCVNAYIYIYMHMCVILRFWHVINIALVLHLILLILNSCFMTWICDNTYSFWPLFSVFWSSVILLMILYKLRNEKGFICMFWHRWTCLYIHIFTGTCNLHQCHQHGHLSTWDVHSFNNVICIKNVYIFHLFVSCCRWVTSKYVKEFCLEKWIWTVR